MAQQFSSVDEYFQQCSPVQQARLSQLMQLIEQAIPQATQKISYNIPTFYLQGNVIHVAAYANHIGLYPGAATIAAFATELGGLVWAKGSVQFAHSKPLPIDLIERMVAHRVEMHLASLTLKKK